MGQGHPHVRSSAAFEPLSPEIGAAVASQAFAVGMSAACRIAAAAATTATATASSSSSSSAASSFAAAAASGWREALILVLALGWWDRLGGRRKGIGLIDDAALCLKLVEQEQARPSGRGDVRVPEVGPANPGIRAAGKGGGMVVLWRGTAREGERVREGDGGRGRARG